MPGDCERFPSRRRRFRSELLLVLAVTVAPLLISAGCGSGGAQSQSPPPGHQFTNFDVPQAGMTSGQGTYSLRINTNGDVSGYYIDANSGSHAFIRSSAGSYAVFDAPGANTISICGTEVTSINSTDETAGFFCDLNGLEHSFYRDASGTVTTFDPAGTSGAQSLNDSGTVAGGYVDAFGAHGYLRATNGTFTTLDPAGDPSEVRIVIPNQINASGITAGTYIDTSGVYHGFLLDSGGTITILDAPGAGTGSGMGTEIEDMNGSGTMVGGINVGVVNGVGTTHSVIRSANGTYTIFDPPQANGVSSFAYGINDSGAIVGTYRNASLVRHGYVREPDGTFVTLDDPNAAALTYSATNLGTTSVRINAAGVVVGLFTDAAGVRHGFMWQ
jgi:hypothetical protein